MNNDAALSDLAKRLTARARALGEARAAALGERPERRWRDARLLWPQFTKEK